MIVYDFMFPSFFFVLTVLWFLVQLAWYGARVNLDLFRDLCFLAWSDYLLFFSFAFIDESLEFDRYMYMYMYMYVCMY